jgi:hypothetical protein
MPASSWEKTSCRLALARCRLYWLFVAIGATSLGLPAQKPLRAQILNKANYFSRSKKSIANHKLLTAKKMTAGDPIRARNDMYEVIIESTIGEGVGLYTIRTGRSHPITLRYGKKHDLLGGGSKGLTGTSYTTVRSYTNQTDYVQTKFAQGEAPFATIWLDSLFINDNDIDTNYLAVIKNGADTTGVAIRYLLPNLMPAPDSLRITQKILLHGAEFENSWVEITTIVTNTGARTVAVGMRYFWDMAIAGDDGPVLVQKAFNVNFGRNETAFAPVHFAFFTAAANDNLMLPPPAYNVWGSGITPANLLRTRFLPARLQQVSWPLAFFKAFAYDITGNLDVTTPADPNAGIVGGDNAVQYFWGDSPETALNIAPRDSVQVTQVLFATLPNQTPRTLLDSEAPVCRIAKVEPGPPKRIIFEAQDAVSGLCSMRVVAAYNLVFEPPQFVVGTTDKVSLTARVFNENDPTGFDIEVIDLCGNRVICDPIFLTLQPGLQVAEYRIEPVFADRYFYIKNAGVERIQIDLNGHEFTLAAAAKGTPLGTNTFAMPARGEMTIDILRYLKKEGNKMTIGFSGPAGSRADLVLADVNMKKEVDFVLNLIPVPQQFALGPNLPNPFRSGTTIQFDVPAYAANAPTVELKIYNLLGQLVRTLADAPMPAGSHRIAWDGRDQAGRAMAAGVYVYSLTANGIRMNRKMALIR